MALIVDILKKSCIEFGDKAAFRVKVADNWIEHSYRDLWLTSDRIATAIEKFGLEPGGRCAILAPSSPDWVKCYLGVLKANGIVVPIDKELKQVELKHILANAEAKILFTEQGFLDVIEEIREDLPFLEAIVLLNQSTSGADHPSTLRAEGILTTLFAEWQRLIRHYRISDEDATHFESLAVSVQSLLFPELSQRTNHDGHKLLKLLRNAVASNLPKADLLETFMVEGEPPKLQRKADDPAVILYTS